MEYIFVKWCLTLEDNTDRFPGNAGTGLHSALRQIPKQRKSHSHRGGSLKLRKWHVSTTCVILYDIATDDGFPTIKSVRNIRDILRLALLSGFYNTSN